MPNPSKARARQPAASPAEQLLDAEARLAALDALLDDLDAERAALADLVMEYRFALHKGEHRRSH